DMGLGVTKAGVMAMVILGLRSWRTAVHLRHGHLDVVKCSLAVPPGLHGKDRRSHGRAVRRIGHHISDQELGLLRLVARFYNFHLYVGTTVERLEGIISFP